MLFRQTYHAPTRSAEYLLALLMIGWAAAFVGFNDLTNQESYNLFFAVMPQRDWGLVGLLVGMLRLGAISVNGLWRRTPIIRFLGSMAGLFWWVAITCLFWAAVKEDQATAFPMLGGYPVLVLFEIISCYSSGLDMQRFGSLYRNGKPADVQQ